MCNHNPLTDLEQELLDALLYFMGLFDTPIGRQTHGNDPLYHETIEIARQVATKALNKSIDNE